MKNYPTSWNGKPLERNQYTNDLFLVVKAAGETISCKDACIQIEELVKCQK